MTADYPYPDHGEPADPHQLRGDSALYARLEAGRFSKEAFERDGVDLIKYAVRVVVTLVQTGEIFRRCALKGRPLGEGPPSWSMEDRQELTLETIAEAIVRFRRDCLAGRGWLPDGGAALPTYFVNTCILAFPNVYRRYQRERSRWNTVDLADSPPEPAHRSTSDDPLDIVIGHETVRNVLSDIEPDVARVLVMESMGYPRPHIAGLIGRTPRAVEGMMYRFRQRFGGHPDTQWRSS